MQCESGFFGKVEVLLLPEDTFYTPQKGTRQKKKKKAKKKKMKELQSFDMCPITQNSLKCYYYFY